MAGVAGYRTELKGYPAILNFEQDPREEVNRLATIAAYQKSLKKYPNAKAVKLMECGGWSPQASVCVTRGQLTSGCSGRRWRAAAEPRR